MDDQPVTLLYLSHLRWEHVWQRPQQLMSRFAQQCRVIYVDPPELKDSAAHADLLALGEDSGVQVLRPIFPTAVVDSSPQQYQALWRDLLPTVLDIAGPNTILWVSSPLADYLVAEARSQIKLAVYDCMDDLASFKDGTAEMRTRETHLMAVADLVFTGGRSMYEARKDRHPRVYCFPSGVDVAHYQQGRRAALVEPAGVAAAPRPRLGYFGVLDERIDWSLIAAVAEQRPAWHWLMVGPIVKVTPEELPQAANIHYFGQQPYADLPAFLKSFDLATMPFALNQATRYISPTKTLEYLAGGKAVISTSVPDVVATYSGIVTIVDGSAAWIAAIEQVLAAPPAEQHARLQRAQPLLEQGSWDGITARMWAVISEHMQTIGATAPTT